MSTIESLHDYIGSVRLEARRKEEAALSAIGDINRAHQFYSKTGVFLMKFQNWYKALEITRQNPIDEFRAQAIANNRPFVMAMVEGVHLGASAYGHDYNSNAVVLKRVRRVQYLVAPLVAIAHEVAVPEAVPSQRHAVCVIGNSPGMWRFHFVGREGEGLFNEFLASFETDKTKRMIMRM